MMVRAFMVMTAALLIAAPSASAGASPYLAKLENCARLQGTARTLVGLSAGAVFDQVISRLDAAGATYSGIQGYVANPHFSIRLDITGLRTLASASEVSSLSPDPYVPASTLEELILDARCLGRARVEVRLEMRWKVVVKDGPVLRRQQRRARELTDRVTARLRRRGLGYDGLMRSRYSPSFTIEASASAMRALPSFREIRGLRVPVVLLPLAYSEPLRRAPFPLAGRSIVP